MHEAYGIGCERQGQSDRWREVGVFERFREYVDDVERVSLAEFARHEGIPESTLRHQLDRSFGVNAPSEVIEFFESPHGLAVLHQIVTAATFVQTQVIGGGVRSVCTFLELSGLQRFSAASYGTQHGAVATMEKTIVEFGQAETQRLSSTMREKDITVAMDETFHSGRTCLLGIEPVSNFILAEEYADNRRAETWNEVMERNLAGLPVDVIQTTSDEGSALVKYAHNLLGVHHSPDLFHPQQDLSRATSITLQRDIKTTANAVDKTRGSLDEVQAEAKLYRAQPRGPGRPLDYDKRIRRAQQEVSATQVVAAEAQDRYDRVREAARGISTAYHPFDLKTGAYRGDYDVQVDIEGHFAVIDEVTEAIGLSPRCRALIEKARRVIPKMVTTITFVHTLMWGKVHAARLGRGLEAMVRTTLIPAIYLETVARKAATAQQRAELRQVAATLRAKAEEPSSPLSTLGPQTRTAVDRLAKDCADLFQRSSSDVEGRNGVLALKHHSLHRLSLRKLRALTVIHNFATTRPDGTTAAERFFEQQPNDLFTFLLERLPPPPRPAAKRRTLH